MRRYIFILFSMLLVCSAWAVNETVEVAGGVTRTLPVAVDSELQDLADEAGLVLLGWTTAAISDGSRPATFYGLGATVTPAVATTYYAFFARPARSGEIILRQCAAPADGDTLILATTSGSSCWIAPNGTTTDMIIQNQSSYYKASLFTATFDFSGYLWVKEDQSDGKFWLRSAYNSSYYLYINSSNVCCGVKDGNKVLMQLKDGFLYNTNTSKYLYAYLDASAKIHWKVQASKPTGQAFVFFRNERYRDFCTDLTPCPGCFLYIE